MISPIHHMSVIRYYPDVRWDAEEVISPAWSDVETAIRRMENNFFPIVLLNTTEDEEFEGIFNICGGAGRWALFQMMGDWQYEETGGGEEVVRLWESDQGYFCKRLSENSI